MNMSGGSVVWILDADSGKFNQALVLAEERAKETGKVVDRALSDASTSVSDSIGRVAKAVGSVGWNAFTTGAGLASTALVALVTSGIRTADYLETTRIAMSGLTGSLEEGNKAIQIAKKFWEDNPFNRLDVVPATKSLIQFGRTTDQIGKDLELLGNISLSTGTPIQELALYFARTAGAGRAMTQDLEIMAQRGVPIYGKLQEAISNSSSVFAEAIRRQYGLKKGAEVTSGAVREMASDSAISFGIFQEALQRAVNPQAMAEFEGTLTRQFDRLKGSISILAGEMGGYTFEAGKLVIEQDGLTRSATRLTEAFATGLRTPELRKSINALSKALVPFIDRITALVPLLLDKLGGALDFVSNNTSTLVPILGGALVMFGQLGQGIPGVGQVVANLSGAVNGLGSALFDLVKVNPLLAGLIALFSVGLVNAYRTNDEFRASVQKLFNALTQLGQKLLPIFTRLVDSFAKLASSDGVINFLNLTVVALTQFVEVLLKIPDDVLTGLITGLLLFKSLNPVIGIMKDTTSILGGLGGALGEARGATKGAGGIGEAISSILKPLGSTEVLRGVASAAGVGVALILIGRGISDVSKMEFSLSKMGVLVASITVLTGLFNLLGRIGAQASVGAIAAGLIGGALVAIAYGVSYASTQSKKINVEGLTVLMAALGVIGLIFSALSQLLVYGAIGSIASAVISGGLLVAALALVKVTELVPRIDQGALKDFSKTVALVSVIMGAIGALGVFSTIGGIATTIVSGGLLVSAIALEKVSLIALRIDKTNIDKLLDIVKSVNSVLALISAFSVFSAIGALVTNVIVGGVLRSAEVLKVASEIAGTIDPSKLEKLYMSLQWVAKLDTGGIFGNLKNMANSAILSGIAKQVAEVATILSSVKQVEPFVVERLVQMMEKLGQMQTGSTWGAITNMVKTKTLSDVAEHIRSVADSFSGIRLVDTDVVDKLSDMMNRLSKIKMEGGGFLENRGQKAKELAEIAGEIKLATERLLQIKPDGLLEKLDTFERAISRNGVGWNKSFATQFIDYMKTLQGSLDLGGISGFISLVSSWDVGTLLVKFEDFERAISRNSAGWDAGIARSFTDFIKILTGGGEFERINNFINNINGWGTESLLKKFDDFERAISRNGVKWDSSIAKSFNDFIKTLTGDGSYERISNFIGLVNSWGTETLWKKLNDFELAVNRNGAGWQVEKAKAFTDFIKALTGEGSFERVNNLIGLINSWGVETLWQKLNLFELAVTRNGAGWKTENAESFTSFVKALTGEGSFERINNLITMINSWGVETLWMKLNSFEIAISRNGNHWDPEIAREFAAFMKALTVDLNLAGISNLVTLINGLDMATLPYKFDDFERAINRNGHGWVPALAKTFVDYMRNLTGLQSFNLITDMINAIASWGDITQLPFTLDNMERAINRNGHGWDTAVAKRFVDFWNTFGSLTYDMKNARAMIESFAGINTDGVANASAAVVTIIDTIVTNITANMTKFFEAGKTLSSEFVRGIETGREGAMRAGAHLQGGVWDAINARIRDSYPQGRAIAQEFVNGVGSMRQAAYDSGVYAVAGFISGAQSKNTYTVGGWIVQNFLKGMRNAAGERSPWKTTQASGQYAVEGLAKGIESNERLAIRAATSLAGSVSDAIGGSRLEMGVNTPTYRSAHITSPQAVYDNIRPSNSGAMINQTNNVYTEVDMDRVNRDLAWEFSKA